jgi:hypothetical protein
MAVNGRRWKALEDGLRKVVVQDGHWLWPSVAGRGYAYFGNHPAHRVVWELIVGPIPEGLVLDHRCSNTRCVNPGHMEPVPQRINSQRRRDAKLSPELAAEIRRSAEPASEIALRLGVRRQAIWRVRSGRAWVA